MATRKRDSSGRVLMKGERERRTAPGYEYRWTDIMGKRRSLTAKTLDELRDKEKEALKKYGTQMDKNRTDLTLNDLYEIWKCVKRGLKLNTFNNYRYMYEKFAKEDFGWRRIKDLKRSEIKTFYNGLFDKGMKPETIVNLHSVIHQLLDLAVNDGILQVNPSDNAMRELMSEHSGESEKVTALSHEEEVLLMTYIYKSNEYRRYYPLFAVMLMAGLRVGEATALQWSDIDFEKNIIDINKTLAIYTSPDDHRTRYTMNSTKTANGKRKVPMIRMVREAFLMEKRSHEENELVCKSNVDGYNDFVFLNPSGKYYAQTTLNKALKDIARDCNKEIKEISRDKDPLLLPRIHCHMLRHTFGTRLNDANANIKAMQALLGHSDIETTMQVYVDPSPRTMKRATDDYQDLINKEFEKSRADR